MYRKYLKTCLTRNELMHATRSTSEDIRFCNGFCQDHRSIKEFSGESVLCRPCVNKINLAKKQINEGQITLEQFKENPEIINGIEIVFDTKKKCNNCQENKTIDQFESGRNECKACKAISVKTKINKDFDVLVSDIEKTKDNLINLEKFIKNIPKDKLVKVVSHFKVGRKSTDTKEKMIFNTVQHFKKLLNPFLCQGGCGFELEEESSTCKKCEKTKDTPRAIEKMIEFEKDLDNIVENLSIITHEMTDNYNRKQYCKIAEKLDLKVKQSTKKEDIVKMINEVLEKRQKEKEEKVEVEKEENYQIELNGFIVLAREEDGFINATALCKAGGKKFNNWYQLDSTKKLIQTLEEGENLKTGIPAFKSVDVQKGKYGGSWIHPDLAVQLAQWISPTFALKVSRWIRQLAITGSVSVYDEKTNEELLKLQKQLMKEQEKNKLLEDENKVVKSKLKKILKKRSYHKFNEGPAFYIFSTKENENKIGFEGIDINKRFKSHRTTIGDFKLNFLVFSPDAYLIEQMMLKRFENDKTYCNHELILDIPIDDLIKSAECIINLGRIPHTIVSDEELEIYNKS